MKKMYPLSPHFLGKTFVRQIQLYALLLAFCAGMLGLPGCQRTTNGPTSPAVDISSPSPSPVPAEPENPEKGETPSSSTGSCDNYADHADDVNLEVLKADGIPVTITMECAGDVDWYKIELSEVPAKLEVLLQNLPRVPEGSDFDLILYDSQRYELENGRSAQSGNYDEKLSLTVNDSTLYLQIYSFSGRGEAALIVTAKGNEDSGDTSGDETPEDGVDETLSTDEEETIEQLTYEEVLSTYFWSYPRGNSSDLLERSVETVIERSISCRLSDSDISGVLTIGNYAHVERDLLQSIDYIDGWALAVFNGSKNLLDTLKLTIRVTILDESGLDVQVSVPVEMTIQGDEYLVSDEEKGIYYLSQTYGDLFGKSHRDLQIFSGVVGEAGEQLSSSIFEQQVEIEWQIEDRDGMVCSGQAVGKRIADFELGNFLFSP